MNRVSESIPKTQQKEKEIIIRENQGVCWNCDHPLGKISFGNLVGESLILIRRTVFRCSVCKEKIIFEPAR
jgi:hypothetical protein